ncbi:methyl-accepting chemotaxis protein [Deinococcus peraridilitoris]|uniref:Methyl-accepting chemotaxis protein n=1 Tax=Deinococcus peraridilitoris (strain DSM 19664 / LMG 22246 / CIP 109416 / KR-200) TaxID=937777 RepID=K9ZWA1_DEIPD|nr:methyl-accepting chemotaxis protein [Deinococcus peraridilitoris]AFZ65851.1 methyl-accepting chemotaxis protein [Deinococcus peraridilitoris DSM 19664]
MQTQADHAPNRIKLLNKFGKGQPPLKLGQSLKNLRVGQKLALIAALFALPIVSLLALLTVQVQRGVNFAELERRGAEYLVPLSSLQVNVARHAAVVTLPSTDLDAFDKALGEAANAVVSDLAVLETVVNKYPSIPVKDQFEVLKVNWSALKDTVEVLPPQEALKAYTDFSTQHIRPFITAVANNSNLILDSNLDSYYAMTAVVNQLPSLMWSLEQMRLQVALAAARGSATLTERTSFAVQAAAAEATVQDLLSGAQYAASVSPRLEKSLVAAASEVKNTSQPYLQGLRTIANSGTGTSTMSVDAATGINDLAISANTAVVNLSTIALGELNRMLDQRVAGLKRERNAGLLVVTIVLGLALGLLLLTIRSITKPLSQLASAARALGRGELDVRVDVRNNDEIGVVAQSFNDAALQLREIDRKNAEARENAELLQQNISDFLDITMDIAEGDFTRRGRVTEDVLGNVVDSINVMVEELESVLKSVQNTSALVNHGAESMLATTDEIVQGAATTAAVAQEVAGEVQGVTASIRGMAENAEASAQTAQLALSASQQGQEAVDGTLSGMQNIRREVQGIAKRIKGLGDRSLEIQEIVDTITRISRQTNLLALNAAIEAAGAGEAGSRFAVVADEVRKLADSSAQATGRIATLIKSVQAEIGEVVVSVEDGTREVEAGYRVASTAGERLVEIAQLAQRSAELAVSISDATRAQVQGVEQVGQAVNSIASVAERSQQSVQAGREAAERLRLMSDSLTEQLTRFRLSN